MPQTPHDDSFADLFGRLPDPRTPGYREATGAEATTPQGGPGPSAASAGHSAAPATQPAAPLSRRAAREQAQGAQSTTPPRTTPAAAAPATPHAATPAAAAPPAAHTATALQSAPTPVVAAPTASPRESSLDDLFSGSITTDHMGTPPPPRNKKRRRIGGWIALGVVLLILGGIASGVWYVWNTYEPQIRAVMGWEEPKDYESGLANGEAFVTIASGDTGSPISQHLFDAGVTKTPSAFYDYLIDNGLNPSFYPGVYKLQLQMTSEAALAALQNPANKMDNTAQLREGLTVDQSLPILADATGVPIEDFTAAVADPSVYGVNADSLEGWLFPATYTFNPDVTAQEVITTLVNRMVQSLDAAGVPVDDRQRILTTASIIQREARYEEDMQKVSTVIVNRLKPDNDETFGKLQMDSTAQYGYGEMHDGTVSTSQEALDDPNPWNTYVNTGLPVGPISNPGDVAIDAAMHPAEGDWLYFVTVDLNTGETVFTSNLADHERAVAQWQDWCAANPGQGC